MYSEEDLIKEKEEKKKEEKRKRVNTFLGSKDNNGSNQEQEEEFYDDFFRYEEGNPDSNIDEEPNLETEEKKESRNKLVILVLLLLVFTVVGILFVKSYSKRETKVPEKEPTVTINASSAEVKEGEEYKLQYSFDNFSDDPKVSFVSSDTNIATVSNDGVVKGVKIGTAKIIMSYYIKGVSNQKEFDIKILEGEKKDPTPEPEPEKPAPQPAKDTTKPTLAVNITNAKDNSYTNHDVVINVSAKDNSGKVSTQYALNCSNNCKYQNVSGGKITINKDGSTVVSIRAVDGSGNSTTKNVTIKIDRSKPSCTLKVATDGTLSAIIADNLGLIEYNGFNKDFNGTKENSKKISAEGSYTYYVKDTAGNTNSCSATVKTKTQYRSRTCDVANRTFSSWRVRKQVYITSCGKYTKYEAEKAGNTWYRTRTDADSSHCSGSSPCYYCTAYIRSITGCNWKNEAWGAYQDAAIESSNTVQVQSNKVFYQ